MGVQSWDANDVGQMGRPQQSMDVQRALSSICEEGFDTLNLDLIYGAGGQSESSWLETIDRTLQFQPHELYLYPLYVRPQTGLARRPPAADADPRLRLYRIGRDCLLERGYQQVSMRMFRLPKAEEASNPIPAYRCQEDGMIGLGCGARSYSRSLHYADEFAVRQMHVLRIIENYTRKDSAEFRLARRGFELDGNDHRRRLVLLSILLVEGLDRTGYWTTFQSDLMTDFPELEALVERDLATLDDDHFRLTATGLELSDAIGPWLYSDLVRRRMEEFEWPLV
jgi:oxygen-independent coproporphyrinogen-3 oxidase